MKPIGLISSLSVFMERDSLISCAEILMNVLLGLHANIFSLLVFSRKRQDILQSKVVILVFRHDKYMNISKKELMLMLHPQSSI